MNHTSIFTALVLVIAACGGSDSDAPGASMVQAPDTFIKPLEREALTETQMMGLDIANLSLEIPWTRNDINRRPTPQAARALVESVVVESHDGFDRMIFAFGSGVAFPGYNVRVYDPSNSIVCGNPNEVTEEESAPETQPLVPEVEGGRFLVLNLHPARTSENGRSTMPVETETYAQQRVHEAGIACAENNVVTWITGLVEGTDVRVLEMRGPNRLVLDVR